MNCPSLSCLANVILKSALSDESMAIPSYFFGGGHSLVNLLPAFHSKQVFISVNKMGLL
jgi:hypothetical protein